MKENVLKEVVAILVVLILLLLITPFYVAFIPYLFFQFKAYDSLNNKCISQADKKKVLRTELKTMINMAPNASTIQNQDKIFEDSF